MNFFSKCALIGHHSRTHLSKTLLDVAKHLKNWGIEFIVESETAMSADVELPAADIQTISQSCDCAISIGGDGNMLRAARILYHSGIPIIGINKGQLGYLTDISPEDLNQLRRILEGIHTTEKRFLLKATVLRHDAELEPQVAFNDVVLFPGEVAQLIEFEVNVNGKFVYRQRADGLILATPTGSTAYSLSAGGPILQPNMNAIVLTPMMPHTLTARPIVIDADSEIIINICTENQKAPRLSHDGQKYSNLELGDSIKIEKAKDTITLIHPQGYDYYSALRSKLQWSQQPVLNQV